MEKCKKCIKLATWNNITEDVYYCDKHVPKSCLCKEEMSAPCCIYQYSKRGFK